MNKADILAQLEQGTGHVEWVEAPELGDDVKLQVRPLSKGEIGRVNARTMRGQKLRGSGSQGGQPDQMDLEMDLEEIVVNTAAAETMTVAFGLSVEEDWTTEEVDRLPGPLQDRLLAKVKEVTDDEELLDDAATFRKQLSGA